MHEDRCRVVSFMRPYPIRPPTHLLTKGPVLSQISHIFTTVIWFTYNIFYNQDDVGGRMGTT